MEETMKHRTRQRISEATIAGYPASTQPPRPHTGAELDRLLQMLHTAKASRIAIGHGRHRASTAAAAALYDAWTETGNTASTTSWPADGASWLRPARRLTAERPDAWVIADTPAGMAQLAVRLADQGDWSPTRTFGFASVASPEVISLTGARLCGMSGATSDGGAWLIRNQFLVSEDNREAMRR
jgi:hypothetical protein